MSKECVELEKIIALKDGTSDVGGSKRKAC